MVQLLTIISYFALLAYQLAVTSDLMSNPMSASWAILTPWVGAMMARYIFLRIDGLVNDILNSPRVLKTQLDRQAVAEAITSVLAEYDFRGTRFQITNEDEASGQLCAKWTVRVEWLKFMLFLAPWEMSLFNHSIDVTFDAEVTAVSADETEVDVRFTNEADPKYIDFHGYVVRAQLLSLIQAAIQCRRVCPVSDPRKQFSRYEQATTLLYEGRAFYNKGKFKRALKWFKNAAVVKPDRADAWRWVAKTLEELERNEEAISAYEKAIRLEPNVEILWQEYASLLSSAGKADEAAEAFRMAFAAGLKHVPPAEDAPRVAEPLRAVSDGEKTRTQLAGLVYSFGDI